MAATKNKLCRLFSYLVPIVLLALLLAGVTYGWQETQVANEFLGIHEEPTNKPKDNEKTPPQVNTNIPDGNVPVGGTDPPDPDPNTNIDEDGIPGAGLDYIPEPPQNIPKTSDDANPRLWLIVLALSTIILRYELFLRKKGKKSKETKEGVD